MPLNSLGIRMDLAFHRYFSQIVEKKDYIVVKTPERPSFFWGNCIIMREPPKDECHLRWLEIFEKEIGTREEKGFVAITFDSFAGQDIDFSGFKENDFDVNVAKILSTSAVTAPRKYNNAIQVKPFQSEEHWERSIDIHFTPDWGYGTDAGQIAFLKDDMKAFKRIVDSGNGQQYGAFFKGEMVGDLSVYWENEIAIFINVATHRNFRRMGICSTLVYEVSCRVLENPNINVLALEADEDYHAARIYESVGFKPTERLIHLEWRDKARFG